MQSVRSDDEIETTRRRTLEGDVYARFILSKSLDGVPEDVVGIVRARLVKDPREITALELHILGTDGRSQRLQVHSCGLPPGRVQESHSFHPDSRLAELRRNVHALNHIHSVSTHIDG